MRILRPSHEHSVTSASLLLMLTSAAGSFLALAREVYIAWAFGAGGYTDAYVAAFTFPDLANYLFAGGAVGAAFFSILARYGAQGRKDLIEEALSVIASAITAVMILTTALGFLFTPQFVRFWFPQFGARESALCIHMTRILFPTQIFVVLGGLFATVSSWRRTYLLPALQPVVAGLFVITAALLFSWRFGIVALAWGALLGSFVGALVLNFAGIWRLGFRLRLRLDLLHPAFREWMGLSLPLMLGASLLFIDDPFTRHFAAGVPGDITRLSYAKRIFMTVFAICAQALGAAVAPHFADLFANKRMLEFQHAVGESIYRGSVFALGISGALFATALPLVDVIFRSLRGKFQFADSVQTAALLKCFIVALVFWTVQVVYLRVFAAIGNTLAPTLVGTVVAAISYPIYGGMFRLFNVFGLPFASDAGMLLTCLGFGIHLQRKGIFPHSVVPWRDLLRDAAVILLATLSALAVGTRLPLDASRGPLRGLLAIVCIATTWIAVAGPGLYWTRSRFLLDLVRRVRAGG